MRCLHSFILPPLLALLGACTGPAPVPSDDGCGAAKFAGSLGQPASEIALPTDRPVRVLGPNDMATMDYVEERINFETDSLGLVVRVTCG